MKPQGAHIQPWVSLSAGDLEVGAWGSFPTTANGGGNELDLYASYSFGKFGLTLTNYSFPGEGGAYLDGEGLFEGDYFEISGSAELGPIGLMVGYFTEVEALYIEAAFSAGPVDVAIGYGDDSGDAWYVNGGSGLCNISLGGSITADTIAGQISNDTITNAQLANEFVSFGGVSLNLGQTDATPAFDLSDATGYTGDSSLVTLGTVTSGDVSAILPAGSVSGSITSPSQGTISINGTNIDLGVQTGDSPQFTNLTLSGDPTLQGDTINANVTNLDIEDRYILLNSGSSTIGDSGIVFGGANGVAQSGAALIWDASYNTNDGRAAVVNNMASNATGDQTPSYHLAGVFSGSSANAATAQADHLGNIRVLGGDIFIYV